MTLSEFKNQIKNHQGDPDLYLTSVLVTLPDHKHFSGFQCFAKIREISSNMVLCIDKKDFGILDATLKDSTLPVPKTSLLEPTSALWKGAGAEPIGTLKKNETPLYIQGVSDILKVGTHKGGKYYQRN